MFRINLFAVNARERVIQGFSNGRPTTSLVSVVFDIGLISSDVNVLNRK